MSGSYPSFAPSSADRWMTCGGSVVVDTSALSDGDPKYRDRGIMLHKVAETCLRNGGHPLSGADLTPDDVDSINAYLDYVRSRPGRFKLYEVLAKFVPGGDHRADCAIIDRDTLEIVDYKTGYTLVEAKFNYQLVIYALGVVRLLAPLFYFKRIRLTVVQPLRRDHPDSWTLTFDQLEHHGRQILERIEDIKGGDAQFVPSTEACRFCKAKSICPGLQAKVQEAARSEYARTGKGPEYAPDPKLDWVAKLTLADLVEMWAKAIRAELNAKVLADPDSIPGFKVVEGKRKSRVWKGDEGKKAARDLLLKFGFEEQDIYSPSVFVTPGAAEKLIKGKGAKAKKDQIGAHAESGGPGNPTVVPESDPKPPIDKQAAARREFTDG